MSRSWIHKDELSRQGDFYRQQLEEMRAVVIELAAALVRMDRNGYQQRTIERALERSGVTAEDIDNFIRERAARIAARKGNA